MRKNPSKPPKKKRRIGRILGSVCLVFIVVLIVLLDFPSWVPLDMEKLNQIEETSIFYDQNGDELSRVYGTQNRVYLPIDRVPPHVVNAFIAIEDTRFYSHPGVDVVRIAGALAKDIATLSFRQGASTITQQLIKLTHLTSEKTLARKVNEAVLALQLENRLSKDEILERYLNIVYFGNGVYGLETAAQYYYGKSATALTLAEGATLAGTVRTPSVINPEDHPKASKDRRAIVLEAMVRCEFISASEAEAAAALDIPLAGQRGVQAIRNGYYVDQAMQEAMAILAIGADELLTGGYRIYTAMDADMQRVAETLFEDATRFPEPAADGTPVQGALIAMDPSSGAVRALIGGRNYDTRRGLNRATQLYRQPGSTFKPISVYAAAIDGYHLTPTAFVDDTQRTFPGDYTPRNAAQQYNGIVTLREALSRSLNVATVDLAQFVGIDSVRNYAMRAGISLDAADCGWALSLGALTDGVTPSQLAQAYCPLANGGDFVAAHWVERIEDRSGRVLYDFVENRCSILSAESAYMITDMLRTAATDGTARALVTTGLDIAGKTGTIAWGETGTKDIWTVAYTPQTVTCVWMGFDQTDATHCLAGSEGGSGYTCRLAASFFAQCADSAQRTFETPDGIQKIAIDLTALTEYRQVWQAGEFTPQRAQRVELFHADQAALPVSNLYARPRRIATLEARYDSNGRPEISFIAAEPHAEYVLIRQRSDGARQVVAVYSGAAGETIGGIDTGIAPYSDVAYTVIPRNRRLYAQGTTLAGEASDTVTLTAERGFFAQLREWFRRA